MPQSARVPSRIGEDRIREAFEYAVVGMAITDLEGHFQETNPAFHLIVGRSERELDRETIYSVTHEEDRANCHRHLARLVAGEIPSFTVEKRYLRPGRDTVWVHNSFSLLRDAEGRAAHIIVICNDITERRRVERLLIENEKLATIGQLASSIAHEINDPLETVINLLFLVQEADTLEEARRFAAQADGEIKHVAQITAQTLRFRREPAEPVPADLAELLESVLALYKGRLSQSRVQVHVHKRKAPALICYPGEIRQVFSNLIRNAIDAMPRGGHFHARVKPATHWRSGASGVRVTVADTGYGMPPHIRARIFEPFFTTKGDLGTGLGLWVTDRITSKHHGSMQVRSSNMPGNSWTAFTVVFPCVGAAGEAAGLGRFIRPDSSIKALLLRRAHPLP